MKANIAAFGSGALFAVGLAISGMTKPSKVHAFLDIAGVWDASLMFVMAGAVAVHLVLYRLISRRRAPLFDAKFHVPSRQEIDLRLLVGAALFGVGWGLGGYCPGPGIVSAASGSLGAVVFVVGMTIGILVEQRVVPSIGASRTGDGGTHEQIDH
jgi:uncharacterized membrane protein YedE/YeeE